jgi:LPXTG-motif cell wall-anchored protein
MYTTGVLGAATTTTAAIVLPNTGSNHTMAIVAAISLIVGVAVMLSSAARLVAKKAYKA